MSKRNTAKGLKSIAQLSKDVGVNPPNEGTLDKLAAATVLRPSIHAAHTLKIMINSDRELDIAALSEELAKQSRDTSNGDLSRLEAMLTSQAHTLDVLFNKLARISHANITQHLDAADRFMRLALRAQSQCRATAETLSLMKNPPPTTFVKQANIANTQQVNNGVEARGELSRQYARAPAQENKIEPNKLLEMDNGKWLDTSTSHTTGGTNSELETVGSINRTEDGSR